MIKNIAVIYLSILTFGVHSLTHGKNNFDNFIIFLTMT